MSNDFLQMQAFLRLLRIVKPFRGAAACTRKRCVMYAAGGNRATVNHRRSGSQRNYAPLPLAR